MTALPIYPVRVGTYIDQAKAAAEGRREATIKHVDADSVKNLSDVELESATFYASIGRTDENLVRFLRREAIRRAIEETGDLGAIEEIVRAAAYEAIADLFENTTYHSSGVIDAYNASGEGIVVSPIEVGSENFDS